MRSHRFIEEPSEAELRTLLDCFLYHSSSDCRVRAHGVFLNAKSYTIDLLHNLFFFKSQAQNHRFPQEG